MLLVGRFGPLRLTALGLLTLLIGVPGLLAAACPMCDAMPAGSGMSCPQPSGPEIHAPCCAESAPRLSCCDRMEIAEPGHQAVTVPAAPVLVPPAEDVLAAASVEETQTAATLLPEDPPRDEGIPLYTLHSVFLI